VFFRSDSAGGEFENGDVAICTPGHPAPGRLGLLVLRNGDAHLGSWQRDNDPRRIRFLPLDANQSMAAINSGDVAMVFTVTRRVPRKQLPQELAGEPRPAGSPTAPAGTPS
jgi:hypothetical protein